jgi:hypothetical protein
MSEAKTPEDKLLDIKEWTDGIVRTWPFKWEENIIKSVEIYEGNQASPGEIIEVVIRGVFYPNFYKLKEIGYEVRAVVPQNDGYVLIAVAKQEFPYE